MHFPDLEKSWNLKKRPTSWKNHVIVVACRSWKNDARVMENHGKIMEFDSGKALGTLHCSYTVARYSVHTVVTNSVHTVDTLYVHCIHTVAYSAHCSYTVTRLQWIYSVSTVCKKGMHSPHCRYTVLFYSGSTVRTITHCTPTALRAGYITNMLSHQYAI